MNRTALASDPILRHHSVESKSFDPWLVWVTLRRCWFWAVPVGLVLACLASFAVLATFEPRFRAQYLLEANDDWILYRDVFKSMGDLAKTEKTIFFNEIVIRPVLSDPNLRSAPSLSVPEEAEANLRENLKVANAGSPSRMLVTYEDSDREYAAKVCNAIVEAYMRQRKSMDDRRVALLEDMLNPEIEHWQDEVQKSKALVRELTISNKGYDPGSPIGHSQSENRLAQLNQHETRIAELTVDIYELEGKLRIQELEDQKAEKKTPEDTFVEEAFVPPANTVVKKTIGPLEIADYINKDAKVVDASKEVARYEALIVSMENQDLVRINRPQYQEWKRLLGESEDALKEAKAAAEERAQAELEVLVEADYQRAIQRWEAEVEAARIAHQEQQRIARQAHVVHQSQMRTDASRDLRRLIAEKKNEMKVVQQLLDDEMAELTNLLDDSANLQFAQNDLARSMDLLNRLEDRKAAIKTESNQSLAVRPVSAATPPRNPVEDIPYKKLIGASGIAFVIPLLIGLLWEMRLQRVTDSALLDSSRGLAPVIGELARSPSTSAGRGSRGRRVFQESVDTMRANIFLSKDTRDSRSIAIVSSMSGEGKSTAASQLAISLAKSSGKTVLLIDGDMRCPDQHDHFGISLEPGLSGVLTDQATLDEAICTELGDLVHVLPAGRLKASPHRLMSPDAMQKLVNQALERYEYVIFDTAPVLSAGETLAVASSVDTTLVCAMRDVTRMDSVVRTTHRLESAGANVAGTIFSGVTPRQYAYRYGDYNYSNFANLPGAPS